MDKMWYVLFCKTNYLLTKKNIIMKKFVNSVPFIVFIVVFVICYPAFHMWNSDLLQEIKVIKDGITLKVNIKGSADNSIFEWGDYKEHYATSLKKAVRAYPFDVVLSDPAAITAYADSVFYKKTGAKASSSIEFSLPEDVEKAMKANKIAELEFQTLRYQIAKDSLISVAAKNDSHGYTAEAERLESRRDQRFNTTEERKLKKATLESNERIEIRKAKALEEAASNAENLDITLTMK